MSWTISLSLKEVWYAYVYAEALPLNSSLMWRHQCRSAVCTVTTVCNTAIGCTSVQEGFNTGIIS